MPQSNWQIAHERRLRLEAENAAIRDSFARAFLSGNFNVSGNLLTADQIAENAYLVADAMMKAREPKPEPSKEYSIGPKTT